MALLPPAYLINLDRSADRLARFHERNKHLANVTRIAAVDGGGASRADLESAGYISHDLAYKPGVLGCALSHIKLWEKAAAEDCAITVFEDDAALSYQFERCTEQVLSTLPTDWDFIVWGNNFPPAFIWLDLGISKARLMPYGGKQWLTAEGIAEFQRKEFSGGAVRLLHVFGTNAYSISAAGARRALDYCRPLRNRMITFPEAGVRTPDQGIDSALCGLYPSIKAFICLPPLAITLLGREPSVIAEINKTT